MNESLSRPKTLHSGPRLSCGSPRYTEEGATDPRADIAPPSEFCHILLRAQISHRQLCVIKRITHSTFGQSARKWIAYAVVFTEIKFIRTKTQMFTSHNMTNV